MKEDPVLAKFDSGGHRGGRLVFVVTGGLHYLRGNSAPYFSITADGFDHGSEFGGCSHEIILEHFPQFEDLVALHLSDINGVPMHAEANGWYDLAGYFNGAGERFHVGNSERHFPITPPADKPWQNTEYRKPTRDECLDIWAKHCRIDRATALVAAKEIEEMWNWPDMRKAHGWFLDKQLARWKAEADACIAKHSLVIFGDKWPPEE